jgi:hypothetical protein
MPNLGFSISLSVAAGCAVALALPTSVPAAGPPHQAVAAAPARGLATPARVPAAPTRDPAAPSPPPVTAAQPARDPAALDALLARYDQLKPGAEREALALAIDKHAGQRYATVSRLYWYTDLPAAEAAARASHRPILALRMLGRLDEDLSCANSRLFRTTLYANTQVSKFLRENFVLYWSSERPVPKVTIEFGDGRTIQGTTTGNSAHYVLDETGAVLDVLPGLYAPTAFTAELTKTLALAKRLPRIETGADRRVALSKYHETAVAQLDKTWAAVAGAPYLPGKRKLTSQTDVDSVLALAQRATFAKAYIEVPQLRAITAGTDPGAIADGELALWAAAGQKAWNIGGPVSLGTRALAALTAGVDVRSIGFVDLAPPQVKQAKRAEPARPPAPVLDAPSRALITKLHTAGGMTATAEQLQAVIDRLEQHIVADSALNQFKLRRQIHERVMMNPDQPLSALNAWIYATVFHTPESDRWLGLLPRVEFTGLPGDGASMP